MDPTLDGLGTIRKMWISFKATQHQGDTCRDKEQRTRLCPLPTNDVTMQSDRKYNQQQTKENEVGNLEPAVRSQSQRAWPGYIRTLDGMPTEAKQEFVLKKSEDH